MRPVTSIPCTSSAFAELSREFLRAGTSVRFRARGRSMAPLVRDGDILLVRPTQECDIRTGDVVIVCGPEGHLIVHRVVRRHAAVGGAAFTIQGDGSARADGVFPAAEVHGKVVAMERGGRQIALNEPTMRLLGRLAALRSRWDLARGPGWARARRTVKRLPVLSRYLA